MQDASTTGVRAVTALLDLPRAARGSSSSCSGSSGSSGSRRPRARFLTWTNLSRSRSTPPRCPARDRRDVRDRHRGDRPLDRRHPLLLRRLRRRGDAAASPGRASRCINGQYPHAALAIAVGIVVCILAGTVWGLVNGIAITKLRLPPFIVTLGTLGMTFGLGELIDGGSYLPAPVPPGLSSGFGNGKFLGLFCPIWVALVVPARRARRLHLHALRPLHARGRVERRRRAPRRHRRRPPHRQGLRARRLPRRRRRDPRPRDLHEHDLGLAPDRQPERDQRRRDRRHEPLRRRRHDPRQRRRRLHPDGAPERPRDQGRPTLLAGGASSARRSSSPSTSTKLRRRRTNASSMRGGANAPTRFGLKESSNCRLRGGVTDVTPYDRGARGR